MQRFLEFMQNHPFLFGILAALIVAYFMVESRRSGRRIAPQALGQFVSQRQPVIIDLRDSKDFKEGHIAGSRNIPYAQLKSHLDELRGSERPVVLVCKMGQYAGAAGQMLENTETYRLEGGILSWQSSGLPLVKART